MTNNKQLTNTRRQSDWERTLRTAGWESCGKGQWHKPGSLFGKKPFKLAYKIVAEIEKSYEQAYIAEIIAHRKNTGYVAGPDTRRALAEKYSLDFDVMEARRDKQAARKKEHNNGSR